MHWIRAILRDTFTLNRKAFELGPTLRCLLGVAVAFGIAEGTGHRSAGPVLAIGAFNAGFTSLQGVYRSRIGLMAITAIGMAAASCIGEMSSHSLAALIIEGCIAGYLAGIFSQFSRLAGVAALNATVAFIIFSHVPLSLSAALQQSLLLLLGASIQIVLLVCSWPFSRIALERKALADAFMDLARFAALSGKTTAPLATLITARQVVADPQPFARTAEIARLRRLLDDAYVLRKRLAGIHSLERMLLDKQKTHVRALLETCAQTLTFIAETLSGTSTNTSPIFDHVTNEAFATFDQAFADNPFAIALARNTLIRLRDTVQATSMFATGHLDRFSLIAAPRPNQYIETRIEWLSLIALRFAVVLGSAVSIGHTLFAVNRGYWIALTAALILKPDLQSTFVRGTSRIFGTLVGGVIIFSLMMLQNTHAALEIYMLVAAGICYATLFANYALFSAAVTIYTVTSLTLLGLPAHGNLSNRIIDTCIGGALAMLGYLCFPTWAHTRTREALAELVEAQGTFAVMLLNSYINPASLQPQNLESMRTHVWKLRTDAEALVDRVRTEPQRPHSIDADRALAIIAAIQSFSLVNLSLESNRETQPPTTEHKQLIPFRKALKAELHLIVTALRNHQTPAMPDNAIFLSEILGKELLAQDDPEGFLRLQLSAYAQSLTTLRTCLRKLCA